MIGRYPDTESGNADPVDTEYIAIRLVSIKQGIYHETIFYYGHFYILYLYRQ
jgi:hypothetical protein